MTAAPLRTYVPSAMPAGTARRSFRPDIQGLRAVAVTLVLVFHLWSSVLPGGFVGVDVFFVISGFLITTHLVEHTSTHFSNVLSFWARRARRLLPASLLVLGVTLVASRLLAPETEWEKTAKETSGATVYVLNWLLARSEVDYLSASSSPSPVQHYWSLSVEEQFYLVWPIVILGLVLVAARLRTSRLVATGVGLALVSVTSFVYSVTETASAPAAAYFVTPTRFWELGVGGLLATALVLDSRRPTRPRAVQPWARAVCAGLGLGAILWSASVYSESTAFPGWRAAVPVLGALLIIASGSGDEADQPLAVILGNRPVQWLGGISYSVYLWHWPLILLVPYVGGARSALVNSVVVVVLTLAAAALTKTYVEDRFRLPTQRRLWPTFVLMAAGMAVLLVMTSLQLKEVDTRRVSADAAVQKALGGGGACFGAGALAHDCADTAGGTFVPSPARAAQDRAPAYQDNCIEAEPYLGTTSCTYGDPRGTTNIAVVGNSHATQWMPAIDRVADANHWKVTTFLIAQCTPSYVVNGAESFSFSSSASNCLAWGKRVQKELIEGSFDLVLVTNASGGLADGAADRAESLALWAEGYHDWLKPVVDSGQRVSIIRDTPWSDLQVPVPECVAEHPEDPMRCAGARDVWVRDDPAIPALRGLDPTRVNVIDMNDFICGPSTCAPIVGKVLVYQDGHHLTNTFSTSLAPFLYRPLRAAMTRG